MNGIIKMINKMEKEFIIIIKNLLKVIDMKEIEKMIKKEKEFIIIKMVMDMKEMLKMIKEI